MTFWTALHTLLAYSASAILIPALLIVLPLGGFAFGFFFCHWTRFDPLTFGVAYVTGGAAFELAIALTQIANFGNFHYAIGHMIYVFFRVLFALGLIMGLLARYRFNDYRQTRRLRRIRATLKEVDNDRRALLVRDGADQPRDPMRGVPAGEGQSTLTQQNSAANQPTQ